MPTDSVSMFMGMSVLAGTLTGQDDCAADLASLCATDMEPPPIRPLRGQPRDDETSTDARVERPRPGPGGAVRPTAPPDLSARVHDIDTGDVLARAGRVLR